MKRATSILGYIVSILLVLLLALWTLIQLPWVQQRAGQRLTQELSKALGTTVGVEKVELGILNRLHAINIIVYDQQQDTLFAAGKLSLAITDWFFNKDTAEIKYLRLEDGLVRLQRQSREWRHHFLQGSSSDTTANADSTLQLPFHLKITRLIVSNFRFEEKDDWRGKKVLAGVSYLDAKGKKFDLTQSQFHFSKLTLENPYYYEIKDKGLWTVADSTAYWQRIDSLDRLRPDYAGPDPNDKQQIRVDEIQLTGGALQFYNRKKRPSEPGYFDERDIIITDLSGKLTEVFYRQDTVSALTNLKAKERSGFRIEQLITQFTMTPQLMEFANLDLRTNRSKLGPYYAMRYKHFDDMEYFIDRVTIQSTMQDAQVSVEDIAVFAPELTGIVQQGTLSGVARGQVSDFVVEKLDLRTGKSRLTGTYSMKGLIDVDNTLITYNTTRSEIFLPDLIPWAPQISDLVKTPVGRFGKSSFAGNFKGTPYDFKANAFFNTQAGTIDADIDLKLYGPEAGYTTVIKRANLDGAYLLGVPKLGTIDFSGTASSNGFSVKSPVFISGLLNEISYYGYNYNDIAAEANFIDNMLEASLFVNDQHLQGRLTTLLNFREEKQRYNARGHVDFADFNALGLVPDTLTFAGDIDVDFKGNTVDEFSGYARFYNTFLENGVGKQLNFDSLVIASEDITPERKILSLRTNEAQAEIEGKFQFSELANNFRLFLSKYYPTIIKTPEYEPAFQDFTFRIETREIEPYLQIFNKNLGGLRYATLQGSLNTEEKKLEAKANIPLFRYAQNNFTAIQLESIGSEDNLSILGEVGNLSINNRLSFPNGKIRVNTIKDSTHLSITTSSNTALGTASIDAAIFSNNEGFNLKFNESTLIANNKKWTIAKDGYLQIKGKLLTARGLEMYQDNQRLSLHTLPSGEGYWNDLVINLQAMNMADWLPLVLTDPVLEGQASGEIIIENPLSNALATGKLSVNQFSFNGDSIGVVTINGQYAAATEMVKASFVSDNPGYELDGDLQLNLQKGAKEQINSTVHLRNEKLHVLKEYLSAVFEDIDGLATGTLQIKGPFAAPAITGEVKIRDANLLVDYTQSRYKIDTATIWFGDNYIDFGSITVKDSEGRSGKVEGLFYHRFFDSIHFNLRMRTDGMEVLNTKAGDNELFYGKAIGKGSFELTGPLSNMLMRITASPTDSSQIFITNKESRSDGEADYIVFKEYGEQLNTTSSDGGVNFTLEMDLTATPLARIDVILDELTGDIISATGSGIFSIKTGSIEPTFMRGRYIIDKGSYNYTFQSLIRKPFLLDGDGNNYLEWNGDPYEAIMNVTATYVAREVSLRDLVSTDGSNIVLDQVARNYKGDVYVHARLRGALSKPDIDFDIEFPQGSIMRNNISALDMLRRVSEDASEKLRQVTYLIVFRSFAPYRQGTALRNPGADLAVNTISEMVSREMGKILTGIIHDITKDRSLTVDLSTNFYNSSQTLGNVNAFNQYDRINVNFNLNKAYFNNRVLVNLGSDFDLNVRNTTTTGFQFLPDVSVEFILTTNRRLRAILFKRDNLDIVGRRNRAGASISYRKDFDRFFGNNREESLVFIRQEEEEATEEGKTEEEQDKKP